MCDKIKGQIAFSKWVKDWIESGSTPKEKTIQPDILDLMAILKILGFKINFNDVSDPKEIAKLKSNGDGIKIIATCSTSGMRCVMELETSCRCPSSINDPKLWDTKNSNELVKYTINKSEIDELLFVPPATEYVIQTVTNHLLHLIENIDHNSNKIQNKPILKQLNKSQELEIVPKSNNLSRQSTFLNIFASNPIIQVTSPGSVKSPARYRSLDTLTSELSISEIPEPGKLKKVESSEKMLQFVSSSSPNLGKPRLPSTSSPCLNCEPILLGYNKLLAANTLIQEVLGIMENNQNAAKLNFDVSKIKGSVDSLLDKKEKLQQASPKDTSVPKTTMKPKCRAPIRSTGSLRPSVTKSPVTTKLVTKSTTSSAATIKSLENVATGGVIQKTPIIKPNPKYMHIKSTISKTKTVTTTKK